MSTLIAWFEQSKVASISNLDLCFGVIWFPTLDATYWKVIEKDLYDLEGFPIG